MSGKHTPTYSFLGRKLNVLDIGGGDGSRCQKHYPNANIRVLDLINGWDVMKRGLPDGDWDVIFANHIIEHVSDPDYLLLECKRVMNGSTILEIGTPNLTAWYNRILFLFGYVPNHVELSKHFNVGKPFDWGDVPLGGHVHVFTIPALVELLNKYRFNIISVDGELSTYSDNPVIKAVDWTFTKLNRNFASAARIRCRL